MREMIRADDRYHRQSLLPEIGREGQAALGRATVAVVGVGALGCASSDVLARAGVGKLMLIDRDVVELTNLQRQGLYTESDAAAGLPKATAARDSLGRVNSAIEICAYVADVSAENVEELLDDCDVIVDGTDNFETRYLLNDLAVNDSIPLVIGGAVGTRGTITPIVPGRGPCLRCLHKDLPTQHETCDTAGVLGPIVQMIGVRQAAIAMRLLVGGAERLPIYLEEFDAWSGVSRMMDLAGSRDADCVCCGQGRHDFLDGVGVGRTTKLCGRGAVQVVPAQQGHADLKVIALTLAKFGAVTTLEGLVRGELVGEKADVGDAVELTVFEDGRAIVRGTEDAGRARSIYSKYVGG
jgi:molybdopterin/thiamine biosynthesis adenylyltransferase